MSPCGVHPHVRHPEPRVLWDARHERWSERRQAVSVDVVRLQQTAVHERGARAEECTAARWLGKAGRTIRSFPSTRFAMPFAPGITPYGARFVACLRMNHAVTCSWLRPVAVASACRTRMSARRAPKTQPPESRARLSTRAGSSYFRL